MITEETKWAFKPAVRAEFNRLQASLDYDRKRRYERTLPPIDEPCSPEPATQQSNVYIFECEGFIKIGMATNPHARLSELQTGNPFPIHLLGIIPSPKAFEEECALHLEYSQYRARGEWFKLPRDVQDELVHHAFLCFENFQKLTSV